MGSSQHKVKPLTVYKASAGSGKTFTLAAEYIKLLIDDTKAYEHILAVTFTNKATEEMKSRILSQLYGIANSLPDSDDYLKKICDELGFDEPYVRKRAGEALTNLLHNYNFFRVQTIDTFFQGVMRNLAKELSLSNNLRISLNDKQVISQAVDSMMETMTTDSNLMKWVEEYIDESMDDENSWNISDDVKSFGGNLTKEFFKNNRHKLDSIFENPEFFSNYKKQLSGMRSAIEKKYDDLGKEFYAQMKSHDFEIADFSYGASGPLAYFINIAAGRFHEDIISARFSAALADDKKWCKSTSPKKSAIIDFAHSFLIPFYRKAEECRTKDTFLYKSVNKTLENVNKLRLLHSIEEEILRQNGEHSRFMLSNTQTLLNNMIGDDDNVAPFIYEKIGSRITHIMIDEFQDTSKVQWKNFKVLLGECMSKPKYDGSNNKKITNNLIVGDVKQSIYRFRSGDWRLLNNIDDADTGFDSGMVDITSLQTNYRSERNIIDFNNLFFKAAALLEADLIIPKEEHEASTYKEKEGFTDTTINDKKIWAQQLRKAYEDVCQLVPEKKESKGLVKIKLIQSDESKDVQNEQVFDYMLENILDLIDRGVKQKDIAILVRNNKYIPMIAKFFTEKAPHINLVSEEAFRLDSSIAVMMIMAGMKLLARPNDKESQASLAKYYSQVALNCSNNPEQSIEDSELLVDFAQISNHLPDLFSNQSRTQEMLAMPLSELCELFLREFKLDTIEGQTIYISTFFDKLSSFVSDNGGVLEDFIRYWDDEMRGKTVSVGNIDGIRIMSMHKSKGLEFDHVIIPYCNWRLTPPVTETLWCSVNEEPFGQLPFIPVGYQNESTLKNSHYELFGCEEAMQEIVDNLNLLYVAFTRAGKSLIVVSDISKKPKDKDYNDTFRASIIHKTICNVKKQLDELMDTDLYKANPQNSLLFETDDESMSMELTFGSLAIEEKKEEKEKKSDNVFLRPSSNINVTAHSIENKAVQFRQSNKSRDFSDDITDDDDSRRFIRNGTILHQVFSNIDTIEDVDRALRELEFEGLLYNDDTTPEQLRHKLMSKFRDPQIQDWFSPRWEVFNECTILSKDKNGKIVEERPDRVITDGKQTIVIDYKFGAPHSGYHDQVKSYMNLLSNMGMPDVKGYIWYVNRNKVETV